MLLQKSALALLLIFSLALVLPRSFARERMFLEHAKDLNISTPATGVKLLIDIFKHVTMSPKLAMANASMNKPVQEPQASTRQGITDYSLAIRPKETGKNFLPASPSIQLLTPRSCPTAADESIVSYRDDKEAPAVGGGIESWTGNVRRQIITKDRDLLNKQTSLGFWEKERQPLPIESESSRNVLSQEGRKHKFVTNQLEQVRETKQTLNINDGFIAGKNELGEELKTYPGVSKKNSRVFSSRIKAKELALKANKDSRNIIALLPPNIVTGIPLIRLGISEAQATSALAQLGVVRKYIVNQWAVLSWCRPQSQKAVDLQLYMHNKLLNAMRVFDASLIASDFGVTLGADISAVKEQFGEPAFILAEPAPGVGQNYIYPINQLGFQFVRSSPDQPPRVVSVLIFNIQ